MRFSLEQQTLELVINYLATKPYQEVQSLIALIQQDIQSSSKGEPKSQ